MRFTRRAAAFTLAGAVAALLAGCAMPNDESVPPDATPIPMDGREAVAGTVKIDGKSVHDGEWRSHCALDSGTPWMSAETAAGDAAAPAITAGHGKVGDRAVYVVEADGTSWYGDEQRGITMEFDADGLRVSGEVMNSGNYDEKASVEIDLPCG